jgi:hypothetical protein
MASSVASSRPRRDDGTTARMRATHRRAVPQRDSATTGTRGILHSALSGPATEPGVSSSAPRLKRLRPSRWSLKVRDITDASACRRGPSCVDADPPATPLSRRAAHERRAGNAHDQQTGGDYLGSGGARLNRRWRSWRGYREQRPGGPQWRGPRLLHKPGRQWQPCLRPPGRGHDLPQRHHGDLMEPVRPSRASRRGGGDRASGSHRYGRSHRASGSCRSSRGGGT